MITRLRTMTRKSTIGFGRLKNQTVDNLLKIKDYEALLNIYYNLDACSFTNDILEELWIEGERAIEKPGKDVEKGKYWIPRLTKQLREVAGVDKKEEFSFNPMTAKAFVVKKVVKQRIMEKKSVNKAMVQGKQYTKVW